MFDLRIRLTNVAVDSIKADLLTALPHVKSSHRVEAAARGLGFRTYTTMRAASDQETPPDAVPDWRAFASYLGERGFQAEPAHLYRACARVAITTVLATLPRLTIFGFETGRLERKPDGTRETREEYRASVAAARDEMREAHGIEQFLISLALLSKVKATKNIIGAADSYWIKHIAERFPCAYPHGLKLGPDYVANGSVIAAAAFAGFSVREYPDYPNASFNMSKRCLIDLDCEVRPTGPYAGRRRWRE